jgi:hypothetical protein
MRNRIAPNRKQTPQEKEAARLRRKEQAQRHREVADQRVASNWPGPWRKPEVTVYLNTDPRTVDLWRETQGLPFSKIGGAVYYRKEAIDRWLSEKEEVR